MSVYRYQMGYLCSRVLILGAISLLFCPMDIYGIPYFARKFNVTCSTCHVIPPKLNQMGENFVANGYTFPKLEPSRRTWPFAICVTYRGESQTSKDFQKTFPNKVELLSGAPIKYTSLRYVF